MLTYHFCPLSNAGESLLSDRRQRRTETAKAETAYPFTINKIAKCLQTNQKEKGGKKTR